MNRWLGQLRADLDRLKADHLWRSLEPLEPRGRELVCDGQTWVNLASNDYLALSTHPHLKAAAVEAIGAFGTGSGASRLAGGHQRIHAEIESRFASFKQAESALIFPTGYMANMAVITSLAGPGDLVCMDKLNHASLLDAAKASGATLRVYPHRHTDKLARLLGRHAEKQARSGHRPSRRLVVTDGVFSMDGDGADLPTLCDLADQYDAILVVDEAHGTGVLGDTGVGLCQLQQVSERVDVVVSTNSKALGGLGGIVTACREIIDTLVNFARPFIYTTAVPAVQASVIGAALDVIRDEPWRRWRVLELSQKLRLAVADLGLAAWRPDALVTPIVPITVGHASEALKLAHALRQHDLFAPAIRPPTVAPGTARVRISLRADLQDADLDRLIQVLSNWSKKTGARPASNGGQGN